MTKQKLHGSEVSAGFKEMNGEGVAQRMRSDRLVDTEELTRLPAGMCDSKTADRPGQSGEEVRDNRIKC
jgi:hypothetical protein